VKRGQLDGTCRDFAQILVDDVADMFEINGERHDLHGAATLAIVSVAYPALEAAGELPALGTEKNDTAADTAAFGPKLP
jgi:hypothetical protein